VCSSCSPASLSPPMSSVSVGGPLDCPGALVGAPSMAPPVNPQAAAAPLLPAALLNTTASHGQHAAPTHPQARVGMGHQASVGGAALGGSPMLATAARASAPSSEAPPPATPPISTRTPTKPLGAAAPAPAAASLSPSDELALFAMNLHLKGSGFLDENTEIWSPIRSPLKCNPVTGKVEALGAGGRPSALSHAQGNALPLHHGGGGGGVTASDGSYDVPDSPLEPGVSKREASFQTQMVRRAVSFIFSEDDASAGTTRRSPLTAIAA